MYQYLFGPVPSRRLGISLGIDLVPMKTCSLNCIYCECGKTTDLTLTRREYVPLAQVKDEFLHYISNHPKPDYITFSGSGEPTLNSYIGEAIRFIRSHETDIPIAVLTNGTLLFDPQVRNELKPASVVMPSLDAATDKVFIKINRPHRRLSVERMLDGLIQFRKEFKGRIWLEIFIVPGINDTEPELTALKTAILNISPDRVQLNTLDRPGPVSSIRSATPEELQRIIRFWQLDNISIIAKAQTRKKVVSYRKDVEGAILETIARRPCTLEDLTNILGLHANEINKYLDVLEADKRVSVNHQVRGQFYQICPE
jgi:wyosine [tRNA(Phe)-imidazoG37] synthetase (radical SAM superfamily)